MANEVGVGENGTNDWRHKKQMPECLSYLSEHKMWHDVTFSVSGKLLHAHRLILSLRSPVFEAMFYGPAADSNKVIEISDIEHDIFDYILRYIYTDVCDLTEDNVLPILYGAKKYCLLELVDRCVIFWENFVTYDNVCDFYERFKKMYDMDSLIKYCFHFMVIESSAVSTSDSSLCLSHESLLEFLSSEHLTGGELDHFRFVNKWADQKCLSSSMEPIPENKRQLLGDIVKKISYQLIKAEDFARIVAPTNILSALEQNQIFKYMATKEMSYIEQFSIPPRQGFPVSINTNVIRGATVINTTFCFEFSCNTKVRLVKLFPVRIGSIPDFGKNDVEAVKVQCLDMFGGHGTGQNIPLHVLDGSAAIKKDIGFTFDADRTYRVEILNRSERNDKNSSFGTKPSGFSFNSNCTATRNCDYTYTNGPFICTIRKIPECVEFVEFKILP